MERRYCIVKLIALITAAIFVFSCTEQGLVNGDEPGGASQIAEESESGVLTPDGLTKELVSDSLKVTFATGPLSETSLLTFSSGKDAALLIIESDEPWTAATDQSWLVMAVTNGDAGYTAVLAGASANSSVPRSGTITITSGTRSHPITVKQSGAGVVTFTTGGVSFKMVLVEGGSFTLGDNELPGSTPAYSVTLTGYYICETEVTNRLWNAVTGRLPYDLIDEYAGHDQYNRPDHPLTAATWDAITGEFLPALGSATGQAFRLPTEAEWEYAAMGGKFSNGYDYAGSDDLGDVGWYDQNAGGEKQAVKQKDPNELGLFDMSGNVSEWCSDWYTYYYDGTDSDNPGGPDTGQEKVVRGGNYTSVVQFNVGECGVKYRSYLVPGCFNGCWGNTGNPDEPECFFCKPVGFRFVLPLEE